MKPTMTDTFGDAPIRFVTDPIRAQTYIRNACLLSAFPLAILSDLFELSGREPTDD